MGYGDAVIAAKAPALHSIEPEISNKNRIGAFRIILSPNQRRSTYIFAMSVFLAISGVAASASGLCVSYVNDGDTLRLCNGERVRIMVSMRLNWRLRRTARKNSEKRRPGAEILPGAISGWP
ncbi:hypothetical protein [Novosphingobium gossypii]|uniref:hypothetical protein n=1 Tax=Novosphingobium gossypii TaxID=1604774 RepID=UPI003D2111EA